jgi:hypothetical protein
MHQLKLEFAQVMAHLPLSTPRRCVARYGGEHSETAHSIWLAASSKLDVQQGP